MTSLDTVGWTVMDGTLRTGRLKTFSIGLQVDNLPAPFRSIRQVVCNPGYRTEKRSGHDCFRIVYMEEGDMWCMTERTTRTLRTGEYAVFAPGTSCVWRNLTETEARMMDIRLLYGAAGFAVPWRVLKTMCAGGGYFGQDDGRFTAGIEEIGREAVQGKVGYKLHISAVLTRFLVNVLRGGLATGYAWPQVHTGTRIDQALWFIEQNLGERITLDHIAGQLGVTKKHACELFREVVGRPPMAYLNRIRVERAQMLLADTLLRTGEIGRMLGIEDEHYFSRMFRKSTGMSPTKYRDQASGNGKRRMERGQRQAAVVNV